MVPVLSRPGMISQAVQISGNPLSAVTLAGVLVKNQTDNGSLFLVNLERHMAVCMDCRCVLPIRRRPTWEDLAAMFEGSTVSGAERAYKEAVQKLTQLLIEDGLFHTIVLKRKRQKKRKEKIVAATYLYRADSDGEWGEIQFDFENKTAQIIQP